jgi:hypothetical protein
MARPRKGFYRPPFYPPIQIMPTSASTASRPAASRISAHAVATYNAAPTSGLGPKADMATSPRNVRFSPNNGHWAVEGIHHSRRPRKRSCDSMTDSSSCARFNPARPRLGLPLQSFSIRRSAAATRSRARSKSAYCRGSGRVRFFLGPLATLARIAALSRFPVAIVPLQLSRRIGQLSIFGAAS